MGLLRKAGIRHLVPLYRRPKCRENDKNLLKGFNCHLPNDGSSQKKKIGFCRRTTILNTAASSVLSGRLNLASLHWIGRRSRPMQTLLKMCGHKRCVQKVIRIFKFRRSGAFDCQNFFIVLAYMPLKYEKICQLHSMFTLSVVVAKV